MQSKAAQRSMKRAVQVLGDVDQPACAPCVCGILLSANTNCEAKLGVWLVVLLHLLHPVKSEDHDELVQE